MAEIASKEKQFEEEEEEENSVAESEVEEEEENGDDDVRWLKHYSSEQEILLVGEGDFSFSLCLALAFCSADNITATSLNSYDFLVIVYAKAKTNLETLGQMGATIIHGVDATKMKLHTDLKMRKFDRIIFNFPHAGFKGKEDNWQLIKQLVHGFFRNARHMLRPNGEVHVSHKTEGPFRKWNLEELACKNSLMLKACARFKIEDYPGYSNKRGDGSRCDQPFPLRECATYKFIIGDVHRKKKFYQSNDNLVSSVMPLERLDVPRVPTQKILSFANGYIPMNNMLDTNRLQLRAYSPPKIGLLGAPAQPLAMPAFQRFPMESCNLIERNHGRPHAAPSTGATTAPFNVFAPESICQGAYHLPPYSGIAMASRVLDNCPMNVCDSSGKAGVAPSYFEEEYVTSHTYANRALSVPTPGYFMQQAREFPHRINPRNDHFLRMHFSQSLEAEPVHHQEVLRAYGISSTESASGIGSRVDESFSVYTHNLYR